MADDYGQTLVNDAGDLLEGTWEWQDTEYMLKVRNIGYADQRRIREYAALAGSVQAIGEDGDPDEDQLQAVQEQAEQIEPFSWEDDDSQDWIASLVEEKLVKPEVDVEETSTPKLRALVDGMIRAWDMDTDGRQAQERMPIDKGNR